MRAALHAHVLVWFKLRMDPRNLVNGKGQTYTALTSLPRTAPGTAPRQRPSEQHVPIIADHEHDIYHKAEMGRVNAEMVRPHCRQREGGAPWGGYDVDKLRVAGLARAILTRLYLHMCSPKYCLLDRTSCRFFYPWPYMAQQQHDDNTERVALRRRVVEDDQWVVPHELYLAMFSPASVNVLPFDPSHGADQARQYATKYASKPEKW